MVGDLIGSSVNPKKACWACQVMKPWWHHVWHGMCQYKLVFAPLSLCALSPCGCGMVWHAAGLMSANNHQEAPRVQEWR